MCLGLWCKIHRKSQTMYQKRTHLISLDDSVSVFAVVIDHLNVIQICVCPVHQLLHQVQSHCSRPLNLVIHKSCSVCTIHIAALQFGCIPIISEKEHPARDKERKLFILFKENLLYPFTKYWFCFWGLLEKLSMLEFSKYTLFFTYFSSAMFPSKVANLIYEQNWNIA